MSRFTPDSTLIASYAHVVYRFKTGELDDQGDPIYYPVSFQNDLEDITCTYGNLEIIAFDPSDETQSAAAFRDAITNYDANIAADVAANKLDLFQFVQHINNFLHVGSKLLPNREEIPTKLSELENDTGFVPAGGTIQHAVSADQDSDGNIIKNTYSTKTELGLRVPANIGSAHKFVYTNSDGKITASDFEIWVTNE